MKIYFSLLVFTFAGFIATAQSCIDTSFRKQIYSITDTINVIHLITTTDNGSLLTGRSRAENITIDNGLVVKYNTAGDITWSKQYKTSLPYKHLLLKQSMQLKSGDFLLTGRVTSISSEEEDLLTVLKIDKLGNLIWQKIYEIKAAVDDSASIELTTVAEGNDGSLFLAGSVKTRAINQYNPYCFFLKLNPVGSVLFSKLFINLFGLDSFIGIFPGNADITLIGYTVDDFCQDLDSRAFYAMKLNSTDASILSIKQFCFAPLSTVHSFSYLPYSYGVKKINDRFIVFGNLAEGGSLRDLLVASFDLDFNYLSGYTINSTVAARPSQRINLSPAGNINFFSNGKNGNQGLFYSTVNARGQIERQRKISMPVVTYNALGSEGGQRIEYKNDATVFVVNYSENNKSVIELMQLHDEDQNVSNCMGEDTSFSVVQRFDMYASGHEWDQVIDDAFISSSISLTESPIALFTKDICSQVNICNNIKIAGPDTVCLIGQDVDFVASKNPECNKKIEWQVDPSAVYSLNHVNDSTIHIRFKGGGKVSLFASAGNCSVAKDTITITLLPVIRPLPEDTVLCNGNTLRLSVGDWFKTYLWQDGSTDSVFIADKPGKYYVQVKAYCGYTISDSIIITSPHFSLGEDKIKCSTESIMLKATPGFFKYSWSPSSYLSSASESNVTPFPFVSTTYIATAETANGCVVKDTVTVNVRPSFSVNLGKDTSVCESESILLNAPPNFNKYLWSNGAITQIISANAPGIYWLQVANEDNCTARDSIVLSIKDCPNKIYFPTAFTPDGNGRNDLFKPSFKGAIEQYEFIIFNRWGNVVFKTSDILKGWNGTIEEKRQNTDSFVWICKYKFRNETPKIEKGSLVLIR